MLEAGCWLLENVQGLIILTSQEEALVRYFAAKAAFLGVFLRRGFAPPQKYPFIPWPLGHILSLQKPKVRCARRMIKPRENVFDISPERTYTFVT